MRYYTAIQRKLCNAQREKYQGRCSVNEVLHCHSKKLCNAQREEYQGRCSVNEVLHCHSKEAL